jgi:hypothetical protein
MFDSQFKESLYCRGKDGKPKKIYPSEAAAWDSAYYRKHESGVNLYPYKCERCGGWHITKDPHVIVISGTNWNFDNKLIPVCESSANAEKSEAETYSFSTILLRGVNQ